MSGRITIIDRDTQSGLVRIKDAAGHDSWISDETLELLEQCPFEPFDENGVKHTALFDGAGGFTFGEEF